MLNTVGIPCTGTDKGAQQGSDIVRIKRVTFRLGFSPSFLGNPPYSSARPYGINNYYYSSEHVRTKVD